MKNFIVFTFLIFLFTCANKVEKSTNSSSTIEVSDVSPWCILGFDSLDI